MKLARITKNPKFDSYETRDDYIAAGIIPIEPMTAKELMEKDFEAAWTSDDYIVEEKIDGVRGLMYFRGGNKDIHHPHCRIFSRRVSVKTNFFAEKSDVVTHLRNIEIVQLCGTVIDGEMTVPNKDFKTVSSILNCLPQEAYERQRVEGKVCFRAFDVIYYKNEYVGDLPLIERKEILRQIMITLREEKVPKKYIREIPYIDEPKRFWISPSCFAAAKKSNNDLVKAAVKKAELYNGRYFIMFNREAYFHYILACGGEGVMVKDKNSIYEQKRTRAYQKVKKRVYRDVVIVGFTEPTRKYEGKFPKDRWEYWTRGKDDDFRVPPYQTKDRSAKELLRQGFCPVTKNWYNGLVGGIKYGVLVNSDTKKKLEKSKKKFEFVEVMGVSEFCFVVVGECEGIDDALRKELTKNKEDYIGTVFEVEGNEIFNDTGKIRHPRYYRAREDKEPVDCTWENHVNL